MTIEQTKILEEVKHSLEKQLQLSKGNAHFYRLTRGILAALEGLEYAKESIDGVHDNFIPDSERDIITDYLYEHHDGDFELDCCEMSDKEILDMYDEWIYQDDGEAADRVARLTEIYNGMRLIKVVNEETE